MTQRLVAAATAIAFTLSPAIPPGWAREGPFLNKETMRGLAAREGKARSGLEEALRPQERRPSGFNRRDLLRRTGAAATALALQQVGFRPETLASLPPPQESPDPVALLRERFANRIDGFLRRGQQFIVGERVTQATLVRPAHLSRRILELHRKNTGRDFDGLDLTGFYLELPPDFQLMEKESGLTDLGWRTSAVSDVSQPQKYGLPRSLDLQVKVQRFQETAIRLQVRGAAKGSVAVPFVRIDKEWYPEPYDDGRGIHSVDVAADGTGTVTVTTLVRSSKGKLSGKFAPGETAVLIFSSREEAVEYLRSYRDFRTPQQQKLPLEPEMPVPPMSAALVRIEPQNKTQVKNFWFLPNLSAFKDQGRIWVYGQAVVLYELLADGKLKEAHELADALVRLGKQEEALGFKGGYHFSYGTKDPWIDPRAPTGSVLWVFGALYSYMLETKDFRHLTWVNGKLGELIQSMQAKDDPAKPQYGLFKAMRYTASLDLLALPEPRPFDFSDIGYYVYSVEDSEELNRIAPDVTTEHQFDAANALVSGGEATEEALRQNLLPESEAKKSMNGFLEAYKLLMENVTKLRAGNRWVAGLDQQGRIIRGLDGEPSDAVDIHSWSGVVLPYSEDLAWEAIQHVKQKFLVKLTVDSMEGIHAALKARFKGKYGDASIAGVYFFDPNFRDPFIAQEAVLPRDRRMWSKLIQPEATFGFIDLLVRFAERTKIPERQKEAITLAAELIDGMLRLEELYQRLPYATSDVAPFTTRTSLTAWATGRAVLLRLLDRTKARRFLLADPPPALQQSVQFPLRAAGLEERLEINWPPSEDDLAESLYRLVRKGMLPARLRLSDTRAMARAIRQEFHERGKFKNGGDFYLRMTGRKSSLEKEGPVPKVPGITSDTWSSLAYDFGYFLTKGKAAAFFLSVFSVAVFGFVIAPNVIPLLLEKPPQRAAPRQREEMKEEVLSAKAARSALERSLAPGVPVRVSKFWKKTEEGFRLSKLVFHDSQESVWHVELSDGPVESEMPEGVIHLELLREVFREERIQREELLDDVDRATKIRRVSPAGTPAGLEEWSNERVKAYQEELLKVGHEYSRALTQVRLNLIDARGAIPGFESMQEVQNYNRMLDQFTVVTRPWANPGGIVLSLDEALERFGPEEIGRRLTMSQAEVEETVNQLVELAQPVAQIIRQRVPDQQQGANLADSFLFWSSLIRDLIEGFIGTAGRFDFRGQPRRINVREFIETVQEFERESGVRHRLDMTYDVPETVPDIEIDPRLLFILLDNLIRNAAEAVQGTDRQEPVPYRISVRSDQGGVVIEMDDQGPGMAPDILAKILQGERVTTKTGPQAEGHGVGTSIVWGIVEAAGGTLTGTSELGRGTTFTIRLPALPQPQAPTGGLEEDFNRNIRDVVQRGMALFPSGEFGLAPLLRENRKTWIRPSTRPAAVDWEFPTLDLWVAITRTLDSEGRYRPAGFDSFESAYWLVEEFVKRGYAVRMVTLTGTPWETAYGVEVTNLSSHERRLVALIPGIDPLKLTRANRGKGLDPQEADRSWDNRAGEIRMEGEKLHPLVWNQSEDRQFLLQGGIRFHRVAQREEFLPQDRLEFVLQADLVREDTSVYRAQIVFQRRLRDLAQTQSDLALVEPGEVMRVLNLSITEPPLTVETAPSEADREALRTFLSGQSGLIWYVLMKLNLEWTDSFRTGLEEGMGRRDFLNIGLSSMLGFLGPVPLVSQAIQGYPQSELQRRVVHGSGLYLWELGQLPPEGLAPHLPRLLHYIKQHEIRKVYVGLPMAGDAGLGIGNEIIYDSRDFEKKVAQWQELLSGLRKAGVQVWLTYTATWWIDPDKEYEGLPASDRPARKLPRDTALFEKVPSAGIRYDLDYAIPVHTRFHEKMLEQVVGTAAFKRSFDGVYLHLEPYHTRGDFDLAQSEYLSRYLDFLEKAHGITTKSKIPLMVNSWQGALPVPQGIFKERISQPVLWKERPLLQAVQERAEVVNVWMQFIEPTVTADHLHQLLSSQNPATPFEVTLELGDEDDNPRLPEFSPVRLWGVSGEVLRRSKGKPFSLTIRGLRPGLTAAPSISPEEEEEEGTLHKGTGHTEGDTSLSREVSPNEASPGAGLEEAPERVGLQGLTLSTAAVSIQGSGHSVNQDRVRRVALGLPGQPPRVYAVLVADGMGNLPESEKAAQLAVEVIPKFLTDKMYLSSIIDPVGRYLESQNQVERNELRRAILARAKGAVNSAHRAIKEQVAEEHVERPDFELEKADRGAALTLLLFFGDTVLVLSVGDVGAYRLRKGQLVRLNVVDDRVPDTNALVQYLGFPEDKRFPEKTLHVHAENYEVGNYQVEEGDVFVVVSDGVYTAIPVGEFQEIMEAQASAQDPLAAAGNIAQKLVDKAVEWGGTDDKSAASVVVESVSSPKTGLEEVAVPDADRLEERALEEELKELENGWTMEKISFSPDQARQMSRSFHRLATSPGRDGISPNAAMTAARLQEYLQEGLVKRAADQVELAVAQVELAAAPGRGFRTVNEGPLVDLFLFKGPGAIVSWAPFVARMKAPVAVITEKESEADGLRKLFAQMKITSPYAIESVEFQSEAMALQKIEARFPHDTFTYRTIKGTVALAEIRKILEGYGIAFAGDLTPGLEAVEAYLESQV